MTLEGLGTIDKPHPLQKAFMDEQAAQCGYCIPGMIMSAKELLDRNPRASEADVREALAGNLCRCGTHNRIIGAVLRAGRGNGEDLTMNAPILSRRSFTKGMGGIVLAFSLDPRQLLAQGAAARLPGSLNNNRMLDAWLRINADGTATVFTGKVELGQGILTALAQIAAEELDLPLARLKMISGDTGQTPNEGMTAGSQSIENSGAALRLAGAEVRAILLDLAAKRLGVARRCSQGRRRHHQRAPTAARSPMESWRRRSTSSAKPPPRSRRSRRRATASSASRSPRLDIPAKVTGGAGFVQDIRLPGMVHGRVVRPPRDGSTLEAVDEAAAKAMPGVIAVVRDGSFLGVVAEREEQAIKAREALIESAQVEARAASCLIPRPSTRISSRCRARTR